MRIRLSIPVFLAATLLALPALATGDAFEEQIQVMNEHMRQLEAQLQSTQDKLDNSKTRVAEQQELIQKAGLEREGQSGLSAFLSETQFSGFVAVSYNYNFNQPDASSAAIASPFTTSGENGGQYGLTAPQHSNANNFQLDQFYLSMMKPATPESRSGWAVDLAWGAGADDARVTNPFYLPLVPPPHARGKYFTDTGELPLLYQAYVEYLAPFGFGEDGTLIRVGRFDTPIGAEEFRADRNWNITRGLLFALQPLNHTGVQVTHDLGNSFQLIAAIVNSYDSTMSDYDNEKTFVGTLSWTGETASVRVNGLYGGDPADVRTVGAFSLGNQHPTTAVAGIFRRDNNDDQVGLLDIVATWDPNEELSAWVNFDYYWFDEGGVNAPFNQSISSLSIWALAVAGRYAFTEDTGFALRGEYMHWDDGSFFTTDMTRFPITTGVANGSDQDFYSLTGTLDHALTDNLVVKVEGRYDVVDLQSSTDANFIDNESFFRQDDQFLALLQMMYTF